MLKYSTFEPSIFISMLVKDLIYAILDLTKVSSSDDIILNEQHVFFLCKKYRSFLIKIEQDKEKESKEEPSEYEYQQICLDLDPIAAIDGTPCTGGYYLRTVQKIPKISEGTKPRIYPIDYYQGIHITYITKDRMRYIGTNPFLQNIIYVSLHPNGHLYFNSSNPQFMYLKKIRLSAVFDDIEDAAELLCDDDGNTDGVSCDWLDMTFPIREHLIPQLIELVTKEILGGKYQIPDFTNNASDDLPKVAMSGSANSKS